MTTLPRQATRPTKLSSLSDQVYDHLRLAIIRSELQPSEKLVELDIAAQMGTSQGPVREALQRLERDGLVERRARSATFVSDVSNDQIYELFSIRSVIEGFAARRTIQTVTPDQCDELDELVQQMEKAGERKEIVPLVESDMQLHRRIVEWSDSPSLMRAWLPLSSQIQRFVTRWHPLYYPDLVEVGRRHQVIVDAMRQREVEGISQLVQDHIMHIWTIIEPYPTA